MKVIKNVLAKKPHTPCPLVRYAVAQVKGIGPLMIAVNNKGICWTGMTDSVAHLKKEFPKSVLMRDEKVAKIAADISAVWTGKKKSLPLPIVLTGTAFQMKVWSELLKIKSGATVTYQDIAKKIGRPRAVRAVGSAVGSNPITLLVPCHRVLSKSGAKLKFGWGPQAKKMLLRAEGVAV